MIEGLGLFQRLAPEPRIHYWQQNRGPNPKPLPAPSSWRASTASDSFLLGAPRLAFFGWEGEGLYWGSDGRGAGTVLAGRLCNQTRPSAVALAPPPGRTMAASTSAALTALKRARHTVWAGGGEAFLGVISICFGREERGLGGKESLPSLTLGAGGAGPRRGAHPTPQVPNP
jgi:hypothetical protein